MPAFWRVPVISFSKDRSVPGSVGLVARSDRSAARERVKCRGSELLGPSPAHLLPPGPPLPGQAVESGMCDAEPIGYRVAVA
jgi:hypothetical protein